MATISRQVVVPITHVPMELMADTLKAREHRWEPVYEDGWEGPVGFHSPNYGSVMRHAYVMAEVDERTGEVIDITKFQFDQMIRKDGPIGADPWDYATPNAMAVVIEERDDGYYVWAVNEWRPAIFDHRRNQYGVNVVGVTGGWAKKVGALPAATAFEELVAETGIEIEGKVEFMGIHTPNRATTETCNEVYMAKFKAKGDRILDGSHEVIGDQFAVRLDRFPPGSDALVNSALWLISQHLGCITAKPANA